jgi:hypothetical protein
MPWYGVVLVCLPVLFVAVPLTMAFHALWRYGDDDDA